ncbi:MAG: asparaginase domain-containing protein [Solirubrobacteraceae bacterium]
MAVFAMGGTIDKDYVVDSASLEVVEPFISWIAPELRMTYRLEVTQLAKKDSLDLADSDRARLLTYVATNDRDRLLITHGTDTLLTTASAVWAAQKAGEISHDKTIVFTGTFRPGRFAQAEASFNVGFALAVAQSAPPGVYVAVGGQFAPVDHVSHLQGHFVYG